jgi:hypothetical protein
MRSCIMLLLLLARRSWLLCVQHEQRAWWLAD